MDCVLTPTPAYARGSSILIAEVGIRIMRYILYCEGALRYFQNQHDATRMIDTRAS